MLTKGLPPASAARRPWGIPAPARAAAWRLTSSTEITVSTPPWPKPRICSAVGGRLASSRVAITASSARAGPASPVDPASLVGPPIGIDQALVVLDLPRAALRQHFAVPQAVDVLGQGHDPR